VTRNEKILARISRPMKILEIGPSYSPVLARADNWDVYSLDHKTAEELRAKYARHSNVDISRIQDVDFVWQDGPIETAIPADQLGTFQACIGSHMIEHMPDIVGFFRSLEAILSPEGVVSLVVPDKRFCFDFFQPITMTGDILAAHREHRVRHTQVSQFNAAAYMVTAGGDISWGQQPTRLLEFWNGDVRGAGEHLLQAEDDGIYHDVHGWYFTLSSFRLLMIELAWIGALDFHEVDVFPTNHCEFFITLARGRRTLTDSDFRLARMDLLTQTLLEVREQSDLLLAGGNFVGAAALPLSSG
jgi:SAM-dependent methyltransferase